MCLLPGSVASHHAGRRHHPPTPSGGTMLLVTGVSGALGRLVAERLAGRDDVVLGTRAGLPGTRRVDFDEPGTLAAAFTTVAGTGRATAAHRSARWRAGGRPGRRAFRSPVPSTGHPAVHSLWISSGDAHPGSPPGPGPRRRSPAQDHRPPRHRPRRPRDRSGCPPPSGVCRRSSRPGGLPPRVRAARRAAIVDGRGGDRGRSQAAAPPVAPRRSGTGAGPARGAHGPARRRVPDPRRLRQRWRCRRRLTDSRP